MRAARVLLPCALAAALSACGGDSKPTSLLVTTPDSHVASTATGGVGSDPKCTPLPDSTSATVQSALELSGQCHFTDHAAAKCVERPGDYYVYVHHDLADEGEYVLTVNVEGYNAPGSYKAGQVNLQITRHGLFYYWSTNSASVTIAEGAKQATVASARLAAQPGTPAQGTIQVSGLAACPELS
jgi:hypothetical protein